MLFWIIFCKNFCCKCLISSEKGYLNLYGLFCGMEDFVASRMDEFILSMATSISSGVFKTLFFIWVISAVTTSLNFVQSAFLKFNIWSGAGPVKLADITKDIGRWSDDSSDSMNSLT